MIENKTLEELNRKIVENKYLPPIIVMSVVLVLGVLGNFLVMYIYFLRFKIYSESRFFIPALAVIDMIACIVNCAGNLSEVTRPIMYVQDIGCKTERYLCLATTGASIFTLLVIAIDRYLTICRPFGRQIRLKWKKMSIAIIVIAAVILSIPYYFFNGVKETSENGITYRVCTRTSDLESNVTLGFSCFYLIIIMAEFVILGVLYFHIGRVAFWQNKIHLQNVQAERVETSIATDANMDRDVLESLATENQQNLQISSIKRTCTLNRAVKTASSLRTARRSRLAIMFLVITVVFAISFIPRVVLMVLESMTDIDVYGKDSSIFLVFLDSIYVLNNIINPFIYGCMDRKFQLELRKMCHYEK